MRKAGTVYVELKQFVDIGDKVEYRPVNKILVDLTEVRIARKKADKVLEDVLRQLKLDI